MKMRVIKRGELPTGLPIWPTITTWLALDHWNTPEWLYGAFIVIGAIFWGLSIWVRSIEESESVFNSKSNNPPATEPKAPVKSKFMQKLDEAMKNGQVK
jgi:hypothetical protein